MPYFRPMGDDAPQIVCPDGQVPFNANPTGFGPAAWGCVNASSAPAPGPIDPSTFSIPGFTASNLSKPGSSSNTLLYAAAGAVALWFLLRKKK